MMTVRRGAVVLMLALAAAGCKGEDPKPPPKCDQIVEVQLRASDHINPGDDGGPLPVVVRIYQLKDRTKFDEADFQGVWQDEQAALGPDVLDKAELTLFPNTKEEKRYWRKADARFLAVVALFRKPAGSEWRRVFSLPDKAVVIKTCKPETDEKKNTRYVLRFYHRLQVDGSKLLTEATLKGAR